MKLEVEQSDSFDLLINTNNNNNNNNNSGGARPSTRRGRSSANIAELTVCSRTTATHSFYLVARQLGHINFTVQVTYLLIYLLTYLTVQHYNKYSVSQKNPPT